ncbi:MAG: hypothetical protein EP343_23605 [Deltaproteobacteria bacterium]|nr:MAG: hypothetical protein EP343_23605 [Deltaproteobacteria bacterium]
MTTWLFLPFVLLAANSNPADHECKEIHATYRAVLKLASQMIKKDRLTRAQQSLSKLANLEVLKAKSPCIRSATFAQLKAKRLALLQQVKSKASVLEKRCLSVHAAYKMNLVDVQQNIAAKKREAAQFYLSKLKKVETAQPHCFRVWEHKQLLAQRHELERKLNKPPPNKKLPSFWESITPEERRSYRSYRREESDRVRTFTRRVNLSLVITGWTMFAVGYGSQLTFGLAAFSSNPLIAGLSVVPVVGSISHGVLAFMLIQPYSGQWTDFFVGVGNVFLGMGGVIAIAVGLMQLAGLITAIVGHTRAEPFREEPKFSVAPWFHEDGVGVAMAGRF